MSDLKDVTIYTDGACLGNPGPGGYGVILIYHGHKRELSGGFALTTNNRMEIMAAIVGIEALKEKCKVTLYSDSQYLVNAIDLGWAKRWQENSWKRNKKERAINPDLWEMLLAICDKHDVKFSWVRGHNGDPNNERCDQLAVAASQLKGLPLDAGYKP